MDRHATGHRGGDAPHATVLRTVGSDIALLCRQVESIRTDEGVPRDVRERLAMIDNELSRIARLTGSAAVAPPVPRLPDDAESAHRLAGHLTEREWQCLELLVRGLNTRAMARALSVSVTTVRTHVQSLLAKLGVNSRLQAVALTVRTGLLDQPLRRGG
ncbi:MAG TPA: LuxR C-terminal-related transcriptional regulator [Actinophytocola sp.]|jgi:DNA-binding NarL/FixJ family response regulator|uniref:helix-turn-helix transcriptional regulator n=1 Tax=Actinophytocola sp. TaxID=1872138 RepID=UPI002F93AD82